jgi:phosphoribosyl-ATP pyrophosphohydrolase/phosphoribosyl-AMP cyclohydrolase
LIEINKIIDKLKFNKEGLIPTIIQDEKTKKVLMLAYMNEESLKRTLEKGRTCFYSRSRKKLWYKGETSGNIQFVKNIYLDCDNDSLLIEVKQKGFACHTGNFSCFYTEIKKEKMKEVDIEKSISLHEKNGEDKNKQLKVDSKIIYEIYQVIQDRKENFKSDSYTCKLLANSEQLLPKKIGEEAAEVIIALKDKEEDAIIYEVADLWFHTLVALGCFNISPDDIFKELEKRRKYAKK